MTKPIIRICLATTGLASVLLALACSGGADSNQNKDAGVSSSLTNLCATGTAARKAAALNQLIAQELAPDPAKLDIWAEAGHGDYVVVYIQGKSRGQTGLKKYIDFFNTFQAERCVMSIHLGAKGSGTLTVNPGFEWNYCPEGQCPGENGTCVNCTIVSNTNTGANTNANTNSPGNARSNSNANFSTNSNSNARNRND